MTDSTDDKRSKPGDTIDIALADTLAGRHWLHPAEKHRGDPRLAAIRAKHRALHLQRQREERAKKRRKLGCCPSASLKPAKSRKNGVPEWTKERTGALS
jgi:hypothetical protein